MRAARYYGPRDVRIEDVAEPGRPGVDEVLLKVLTASICGTDASQYLSPTMIPLHRAHAVSGHCGPITIGHEVCGVVIAKGSNVEHIRIGDRVVPGSGWWCGECPSCQVGRINICERYFLYGIHCDGGLAEQAIFPAKMCLAVPPRCVDIAAALAQPTAVALHALRRLDIGCGNSVALFGAGNIGSLLLAVLQAQGIVPATIIAVDIDESRLMRVQRLGATHVINVKECLDPVAVIHTLTHGYGVDVAIEATGNAEQIHQAIDSVHRGGIVLQVGIPTQPVTLSLDRVVLQEKTIITSNGQSCMTDLPQALDLLTRTDLVTRLDPSVVKFDRLVEDGLLPLVEHRATGKIIFELSQ